MGSKISFYSIKDHKLTQETDISMIYTSSNT